MSPQTKGVIRSELGRVQQGLALRTTKSDTAVHGLILNAGCVVTPALTQAIFLFQAELRGSSNRDLFNTLQTIP